jgi:hypothetical protein
MTGKITHVSIFSSMLIYTSYEYNFLPYLLDLVEQNSQFMKFLTISKCVGPGFGGTKFSQGSPVSINSITVSLSSQPLTQVNLKFNKRDIPSQVQC